MSEVLQISLILAVIVYFVFVFLGLKKGRLALKYTLLWLLFGIVQLLMAIFPNAVRDIFAHIGIEIASNGVFAVVLFFVLAILISITSVISKMNDKITVLTQQLSLCR